MESDARLNFGESEPGVFVKPLIEELFNMSVFSGLPNQLSLDQRKRAAWEKASPVIGYDPTDFRRDAFSWWIRWSDYGNRDSDYGWEIDHTTPSVLGGGDALSNLRALHWRNNASLGGLLSGRRR